MIDDFQLFLEKIGLQCVDPRLLEKNKVPLDRKIKNSILKLNKSGWCWTLFCCSGHTTGHQKTNVPYIVFVVKNNYKKYLLNFIADTFPKDPRPTLKFPLVTCFSINLQEGFSDENYTIISVYWYGTLESKRNLHIVQNSMNDLADRISEANYG